ncbi:P-loop containing nucleoside triphosphate hydrolases superfamily protein [Rhynchospora pubera]|uniref:P-loop containing nucleoside triphosphate hydrolases superfamily protein n=1 Tax=Rhynchospora pubera TaxID=906938 RepID=A0AAV8CZJ6_9POAL|nr:P-loop containing nucleoside triphosphate hydrolases superfamily protein [Rhynchospora pubera]
MLPRLFFGISRLPRSRSWSALSWHNYDSSAMPLSLLHLHLHLHLHPHPHLATQANPTAPPPHLSFLPLAAFLFGSSLGLGSLQVAYADSNQEEGESRKSDLGPVTTSSLGAEGPSDNLVADERKRIDELLKSNGMPRGSYPPYSVSVKGPKQVTVKFKIPPACEVSHLIIDLTTHLGYNAEQNGSGSEMLLRAWDNAAAKQITLSPPLKTTEAGEKAEADFFVLIFESLIAAEFTEIEFIKQGRFSSKELDAVISALKLAGRKNLKGSSGKNSKAYSSRSGNTRELPSSEKTLSDLEAMGVRIYGLDETTGTPVDGTVTWDNIAGYDEQKREIEDTVLLALQSPEVYDDIARGTRRKFETNRPRAILFEGPPGTGKTSSARVIAKQAGVPLLYVPLEVIMSKFYGESERLLGNVFSLANDLPDGAIVFLDEVDSFAAARDSEMHEATRRILSVILRQIDGFEQEKRVVVIAATNRKEDLDPALISRFDSIINFDLPDRETRAEIAAQYAKQLNKDELIKFSLATEGMSGRDIRDVCQQAERHWASKLIRGQVSKNAKGEPILPTIQEYVKCAEQRRNALPAEVVPSRSTKRPFAPA